MTVSADEALQLVGKIASRFAQGEDLATVAPSLVDLMLSAYPAQAAFVARCESEAGLALRWLHGRDRAGKVLDPQLQGRNIARVEAALREASSGVRDAPPPSMTGGAAPAGAIAIKADAGNPPLHCFPLLEGTETTSNAFGVLGLIPDPAAPLEADQVSVRALIIARDLARARLQADLEKDRGRALVEAALGGRAPEPTVPAEPSPDEESSGSGDPRGFKNRYDEIVTRSPKMFEIFRKLDRVTPLDVPVLIQGETGTGKELIARAIHRNSPRRKRRFYTVNSSAFAESLLESELFGHEKNAFTGADRYKKGLFEIATGSTLFLDEIGEMNLDMQKKLLRVLQEGEVLPLGTSTPVKVDVRIVCATNRNLAAEVATGGFREDLLHRLNVIKVELPPLRERPEDISFLIEHFLKKIARARGDKPKVLDRRDPRILKRLLEHPWKGNIRELENVVSRCVHLSGDLINWDVLVEAGQIVTENPEPDPARPVRPLEEVVEEVERSEIMNALRQTNGNRTKAAALLKINRRSLLRRLRKYGLASEEDEDALEAGED